MVSRLERGGIGSMTVAGVEQLAAALGASVHLELRWKGEQLDRLIDAGHAAIAEMSVQVLRGTGWRAEAEVSFNWYGDRGRCDAVAFDAGTSTLLVVEAKTRIGDVQEMLGRLDIKVRLGRQIARSLGWPEPAHVIGCLVIADGRTARRVVASHPQLFAKFTHRGRAAKQWLANPDGTDIPGGILLFESLPDSHRVTTRQRARPKTAPDSHVM
jgi:hypothetical protein